MSDRIVTKREILFSIVIVSIMILIGFYISDKISDSAMTKNQEYNTALRVNNDKELFEYGMRTNIGNAFVYGELKAVDPVGYKEIEGEYSYIEKVKEKYTKHTRVVKRGKRTIVETYWTWDEVDSQKKHSTKITFLDVKFDYGVINFPSPSYISTIKESNNIRYVYYGAPAQCKGTLYAKLKDDTINDGRFYRNNTIEETINSLESDLGIIIFWILWVLLTGGIVAGFYFIDNKWLEDKK